jgi:hypothetical protein
MQVRGRGFDVEVLVLSSAALRSEYTAAMDLFEIPVGELVMSLGLFRTFVIDSQVPFAVFGKAVAAKEFIFLFGRGPVLTPRIPVVEYN